MSSQSHAKLAIVVLSYNGKDLLKQFIPPILQTRPEYAELYIVDNASVDGTYEFVEQNFPEAKLIRLPVNHGFTNGYVESLSQIKADYYVLISSDVEVLPGWVEPIINLMDSDPTIGVTQPKIRFYRERALFEYSGAAGGFMDKYGYPFCRGRIFFTLEEDKGQYDDIREVFWCSGACMFIRAELYHRLGGLDNDYYAHMEDIDLSWRVKNAGYKVMVCPQAVVFHVGGSVITYGSPQKIFRNYKNNTLMLIKNLPGSELWWKLPARMVLDGIAGLRALFIGNFKEFWAILRAHGHIYSVLGLWIRKRKAAQQTIVKRSRTGIYPHSIVFKYFMQGIRKFSDLKW